MALSNSMYDNALLGILQNEGQIMPFLDVIFGFLYRRTDFYRLQTNQMDKLGFPIGVTEKMVISAFKKYQLFARRDERSLNNEPLPPEPENSEVPPAVQEISVITSDVTSIEETSISSSEEIKRDVKYDSEAALKNMNLDHSEKAQEIFQSSPESYNGAIRENYCWCQTIKDLDVQVKVPSNITKAKDVKVEITNKTIKVQIKDLSQEWCTLVEGNLTWKINVEESLWNLVPGEHVLLNLEKFDERWWDAILENEPKINIQKIDASRPYEDLDAESQAKIQELQYNEHMTQLGKPTIQAQKTHDMLKEAWNAEGSPFKGQPYDPSIFNVIPTEDVKKSTY